MDILYSGGSRKPDDILPKSLQNLIPTIPKDKALHPSTMEL